MTDQDSSVFGNPDTLPGLGLGAVEFPPKAEFRKWLRSLPPDLIVAADWNCHNCPLAMWLHKTGVAPEPYIRPDLLTDASAWRKTGRVATNLLPNWANEFGKAIDKLAGDRRGPGVAFGLGAVTAIDCLKVLRRTPKA